MTIITIIGDKPKTNELKKIEFFKGLTEKGVIDTDINQINPSEFNYIEVICLGYSNDFDLLFAYDDENKRHYGILYLGKFNDGVV